MLVLPAPTRAELNDLALATLEHAADIQRTRGLKLLRPVETVRWPRSKLAAEVRRAELVLDPRPGIAEDLQLYQALGVMPLDDEAREAVMELDWPRLAGAHFPSETGTSQVALVTGVSAKAREAAHMMTVGLAILGQHHSLEKLVTQGSRDHQLAAAALVTGDTVLVWLARSGMPHEGDLEARQRWAEARIEEVTPRSRSGAAAGQGFGDRLITARLDYGVAAALALRQTSPWGVFDEHYRHGLPRSTMQLLHSRALLEDRQEREVVTTTLSSLGGRGQPRRGTIGELRLRLWLETWLEPEVAARAAAGWAGDAYQLYLPQGGGSGLSPVVALTAWDTQTEGAEAEARDFAGAAALALGERFVDEDARLLEGLEEGARGWRTDDGLGWLVERRGDQVLLVFGCPAERLGALQAEVWEQWTVGRPDLGVIGDLRPAPPAPIAPLPPPLPWYRGTPGLVALGLWLLVLLPLVSFVAARRLGRQPVGIYMGFMTVTIALIVVGWFLGL